MPNTHKERGESQEKKNHKENTHNTKKPYLIFFWQLCHRLSSVRCPLHLNKSSYAYLIPSLLPKLNYLIVLTSHWPTFSSSLIQPFLLFWLITRSLSHYARHPYFLLANLNSRHPHFQSKPIFTIPTSSSPSTSLEQLLLFF